MAAGCGGGGSSMSMAGNGMGTIVVSVSDPPSCKNPNGSFEHVYITVRSVQAHVDPHATDSSSGWQELAPQLANPMQIDLFSAAETNCILAQLGSASLPAGSYQQIRLLLVSNAPGASDAVPSNNATRVSRFRPDRSLVARSRFRLVRASMSTSISMLALPSSRRAMEGSV